MEESHKTYLHWQDYFKVGWQENVKLIHLKLKDRKRAIPVLLPIKLNDYHLVDKVRTTRVAIYHREIFLIVSSDKCYCAVMFENNKLIDAAEHPDQFKHSLRMNIQALCRCVRTNKDFKTSIKRKEFPAMLRQVEEEFKLRDQSQAGGQ